MSDTVTISKKDLAARDRKASEFDELQRKYDALKTSSGNSNSAFTREDEEQLGELYEPVKKLIEGAMGGVTSKLDANFDKMNTAMSNMQEQMQTQGSNFFGSVASSTLKNYEKVKGTDEFEAVLDQRITGTDLTFRDTWKDAEEKKNLSVMQEVVDLAYKKVEENIEEPNEPKPNFEPNGSPNSASEDFNTSGYIYKVSDYQRKVDEMKAGEISSEALDDFEKKFYDAADQGKVLDDSQQSE